MRRWRLADRVDEIVLPERLGGLRPPDACSDACRISAAQIRSSCAGGSWSRCALGGLGLGRVLYRSDRTRSSDRTDVDPAVGAAERRDGVSDDGAAPECSEADDDPPESE